jgi:hypothetical protein
MLHCIICYNVTDVSEVFAASIIIAYRPDDGRSNHLWNVGNILPDYTM